MAKSDNKTQKTEVNPLEFIEMVEHPQRKADAYHLLDMITEITGDEPYMYGPSIIGFGSYHYVYDSGREGDAPLAGFSPRKAQMVVYLIGDYEHRYPEQLARVGKWKPGKACFYFNKLDDIDEDILRFMIKDSYDVAKAEHS